MNKIGFGLFCFGDDYYFKMSERKIINIIDNGYKCFILTDNIDFFLNKEYSKSIELINYKRDLKSYHDKVYLIDIIFNNNLDIAILMDTDLIVKNYNFLKHLRRYNFPKGISYINTLENHLMQKKYVTDFKLNDIEWKNYINYCENIYPKFIDNALIWEYFLVFNKDGFNYDFFKYYNVLKKKKEECDIDMNKKILAPAEGISITIASALSKVPIQRDMTLYNTLDKKVISISRMYISNPEKYF